MCISNMAQSKSLLYMCTSNMTQSESWLYMCISYMTQSQRWLCMCISNIIQSESSLYMCISNMTQSESLLYRSTSSMTQSVSLLYICVYSMSQSEILSYMWTPCMTQSLKACSTVVQVYILKLAVLLYRRTSLVCGWSAAPNAPTGKTRVRSCSRLPIPVAMWTTAGCTSKSTTSSPRPTVLPAVSYDSDDNLEAIRRQHNDEEGLASWNPQLIKSIDASQLAVPGSWERQMFPRLK